MQRDYQVQNDVLCSDLRVLDCSCGEELILIGHERDWYAEGRTAFGCRGCGAEISLTNVSDYSQGGREPAFVGARAGADEEELSVRELVRYLRAGRQ